MTLPSNQCTCGHARGDHHVIGGQAICNVSPCGCMDFETVTSKKRLTFEGMIVRPKDCEDFVLCPKSLIDRLRDDLEFQRNKADSVVTLNTGLEQERDRLRAGFKNFHRLLCERFGYGHDEIDWQRDQLSLIEWIAKGQQPHDSLAGEPGTAEHRGQRMATGSPTAALLDSVGRLTAGESSVETKAPSVGLLVSMAMRMDHGLGVPGYYDQPMFGSDAPTHKQRLEAAITTARQMWEEVVGLGFYSPEREAEYASHTVKAFDDPLSRYSCFVEGCPGNHPSKRDGCHKPDCVCVTCEDRRTPNGEGNHGR